MTKLTDEVNQSKEIVQAKVLLHNEYLLLQILKSCPGVERCYGLFVVSGNFTAML